MLDVFATDTFATLLHCDYFKQTWISLKKIIVKVYIVAVAVILVIQLIMEMENTV